MDYTLDAYLQRLSKRIAALENDPAKLRALTKVGLILQNRARVIATQKGIIRSGNLRQSITYRINKRNDENSVQLSAFGVKYANLHEFGGKFTPAMRAAMFAKLRETGQIGRASKGIVQGGHFKARSYMREALRTSTGSILEEFKSMIVEILSR